MCLSQSTLSYKECICVEIKFEVFIKFNVIFMCITQWVSSIVTEKVLDQMEYKLYLAACHLIPASVNDIM